MIRWIKSRMHILPVLLITVSLFGQYEWGQQVIEATMTRYTAAGLGNWAYPRGFYLFGQYRFWKLTGDDRYFQFLRNWVDSHVNVNGNIDADITSLDNTEPGLVTLLCYVETGEEKYRKAADFIRNGYQSYPRTTDGAFWHNTGARGQLWSDGVYMVLPFLVNYGKVFNEPGLYDECAYQLITYASHLQDDSGLLYHAYDEDGSSEWADPVTHHSPWFWGRAIGWFGMACIEVLEVIPEDHPDRQEIIEILSRLIQGLSEVQDEDTGLFYEVVDQGQRPDNWLESSCSCMYSFFTARAVARGYVDGKYMEMARRAYEGVLRYKFSVDAQDLTFLIDICQGTGVSSDYSYYINRSRNTNDLHGLGAFLMMCWQMTQSGTGGNRNRPPIVTFSAPPDSSIVWPGTDVHLAVSSFDLDGQVIQVSFYANGQLLGTVSQPPWEMIWEDVKKGEYILTAEATDDSASTAASKSLMLDVSDAFYRIEAETGVLSEGTVDNNHAGYTGSGFVNLVNRAGTYLDLTIDLPEAGPWTMRIRYANGTADNRPCELRLDGQVLDESFDFPPTGDWTDWAYSDEISINVSGGSHDLRVTGLEPASAPNLDHFEFFWQYSGVENREATRSPAGYHLHQNYPNPFNPSTIIRFDLPASRQVKIVVYNLLGEEEDILLNSVRPAGENRIIWNAGSLPEGVYYYRMDTEGFTESRKMILMK